MLLPLLLLLAGAPAHAAAPASIYGETLRWLGFSAVAPYLGRVVSKPSGEAGALGDLHGIVRGGVDAPLEGPFIVSTSVGLSVPFISGPTNPTSEDDAVTKRLYFIEAGPAINLGAQVGFTAGLGLGVSLTTHSPNGGAGRTAQLPNGTGTATFGLPENARTVSQFFLKPRVSIDAGFGRQQRFGVLLEALVYAPLSSARRSVAAALGIYVGF